MDVDESKSLSKNQQKKLNKKLKAEGGKAVAAGNDESASAKSEAKKEGEKKEKETKDKKEKPKPKETKELAVVSRSKITRSAVAPRQKPATWSRCDMSANCRTEKSLTPTPRAHQ